MTRGYPDHFARFYDVIYHEMRHETDSTYFLDKINQCMGHVLDIGVGTGRFFVEALNNGADIFGIDISKSMIRVLKSKLHSKDHHRISIQNVIDFQFDNKFDLIIAPFRVMMHLINKEDQLKALNNVFDHLNQGGSFIFDVFVPDFTQLIYGLKDHTDFEGEYEPGKQIKRTVSTEPDTINQIINITFQLEWDEDRGKKTATWMLPLRFYLKYELEHLIERSKFQHYHMYGDYQENALGKGSKEFLIVCNK